MDVSSASTYAQRCFARCKGQAWQVCSDSCTLCAAYQSDDDVAVVTSVHIEQKKEQKEGRPLGQQVESSTETNSPKTAAAGAARFDAVDEIIASCRPVAITVLLARLLKALLQWAHSWQPFIQMSCRSTYRPRCAASG
eukprot:6973-Heterococcus_DN1.PRE.1